MKKRVLIVDDEIDTLKLLKMIVEISGYEVYTTLNSLEAIAMAQVEQPDVVLLDIMMPKMDGFQLCKLMRAHPDTKHLPIIFVTAYSALDLEDRKRASGGDMILPKPVGMDSLIEAIEKVQLMERVMPIESTPEPVAEAPKVVAEAPKVVAEAPKTAAETPKPDPKKSSRGTPKTDAKPEPETKS